MEKADTGQRFTQDADGKSVCGTCYWKHACSGSDLLSCEYYDREPSAEDEFAADWLSELTDAVEEAGRAAFREEFLQLLEEDETE